MKPTLWQTPAGIAAIVGLLSLGIWLRITNLDNVSFRSPDEQTYTRQARVVLNEGTTGLRTMAAEYVQDVQHPTRAGYIWLVAAAMRVTGRTDEKAGAYLSCAASIGSLIIATIIAVRFFPAWAPLVAILFFCVSPPELAVARRAWGDALVEFFALILFWMTAEITRDSRPRIWYVLFVLAGIGEFVIKESGVAIFALSGIALLWPVIRRGNWRSGLAVATATLISIALSVAWLSYSLGGFSAFVNVTKAFFSANEQNPYVLEFQSGPGHLLLQAFWALSPTVAFFSLIGLVVISLSREYQALHPCTSVMLVILAVPIVLPHWLNLRYLTFTFGPWCLLAGFGCWFCVSVFSQRLGDPWTRVLPVVWIALAAVAAWGDYQHFQTIFVRHGLPDLSIKMLLGPN